MSDIIEVAVAGAPTVVEVTIAAEPSLIQLEAGAASTSDFATAAKGVTNGDTHDHVGGDGAQIDYTGLSNKPTLGSAAAAATTDFAPAAKGVTGGDAHDHTSGNGAQIDYTGLSNKPTLGSAAAAATSDFATAAQGTNDRTASGLRETGGPTVLAMGAVADGQVLKRVGSTVVGAAAGSGDASTNASSSVANELALFANTTGKLLKRSADSGIPKLTAGVVGAAGAGDVDALLPTQTGHAGQVLTTNGSASSWSASSGGVDAGTAAGMAIVFGGG